MAVQAGAYPVVLHFYFVNERTGAPIDLAGKTPLKVVFFNPIDSTRHERDGTIFGDSTNGIMEYVTVAGDIPTAAPWQAQGWAGTVPSAVVPFPVEPNL